MTGKENGAARSIERQAGRMASTRRHPHGSLLFGLGMFGMIGWSVAVPTVAGIFIGVWLDRTAPAGFSWTLSLLVVGAIIGCLLAWQWVEKERHHEHEEQK